MPVLPFHRYLGPGNPSDNGPPTDKDDQIAQEHDSAYETALTAEDVSRADREAVHEFWDDFSTTGNWHSLIGAAGLALKQKVEQHTGILYPNMSAGKHKYKSLSLKFGARGEEHAEQQRERRHNDQDARRDRMQDPGQPGNSRDVSDVGQNESNAPMATDEVDAQQNANTGGTGGVTNPGGMATLYLNKSFGSPGMTFFKKSRLMHCWGFTSGKFPRGPSGTNNFDYVAYNTSLAYVPVDWIPFYLSPVEFDTLPNGAYIKEVYVEVIPKGVRCSFDTGSTLTGSANSMHVIFGKHCVGLNHNIDMVNMKLKQKDSAPMYIESIEEIQKPEFTKRFYGDHTQYHSSTTDMTFPTSWGANRALPYYACLMATTNTSNKNEYHIATGWPRLDNIIEWYNLNEHINTPCIKYSYKPRNGTLKHLYNSAVVPNKVIPLTGRVDLGVKKTQFIENGAFAQSGLNIQPFRIKNRQVFAYENIVEKNHLIVYDNNLSGVTSQPQVHIGIEPVQSNAPADLSPNFVNASAEYEIKATCIIAFNTDYMYANNTFAHKSAFPAGYKDTNQHYLIGQNHVGGHYAYNWAGKYDTKS